MAHVWQQIREAAGTVLKAGVPLVSNRVYESRLYPLNEANVPAILVATIAEQVQQETINSVQLRSVVLAVDVVVTANVDYDDAVDNIRVQVEKALTAARGTQPALRNIILTETDAQVEEAQKPLATASMLYRVDVYTVDSDPEVLI